MADDAVAEYTGEADKPTVEKVCPECSAVVSRPNAGLATVALATHRRLEHGIGDAPYRKKGPRNGGQVTDVDPGTPQTLAAVRSIADGIGKGKNGAPSANDLANGFGRGLGLLSCAVASYAVETDETIPEGPEGDATRNALIDYLSFTDRAAKQIMEAPAKAFAPTKLNKRVGRQVVDNVEVVASAAEIGIMFAHWRRYFRGRRYREQMIAQSQPPAPVVIPAEVINDVPAAGGAAGSGVLMTKEMVDRLAGRHG